ncbi:hypothetical protein OGH69_08015 [Flavobacterium sp. MFBS3-15]|uniref:hypothetical protein n=1 Tax=Flavobacterium sp. MFBS3-15 TaxID=2989816 RepID=UPI0022368AB0|nr:hypothetical protein [Flavobacterium sp. MFBS3-15]MCW4468904.1 hypothetical protein [Flavobacterium sp. MFBS3-15]
MRLPVKYIQILILLLTVLIATPCSIKKMYADFAGVEAPQKNGTVSVKLQCHAFVADATERKAEKAAGFRFSFSAFPSAAILEGKKTIPTTPFFLLVKEKISSYLLYRTLLI